MKGPFGLLLIGGGIILIVGIFTGKITFPGSTGTTGSIPVVSGVIADIAAIQAGYKITAPGGQTLQVNPGGQSVKSITSGGKKTCPPGFVIGSDGNCYVNIGG